VPWTVVHYDPQMLTDGRLDITVGGRIITPARALDVSFSTPYTQKTVSFMVKDSRRDMFSSVNNIRMIKNLNIGLESAAHYRGTIAATFPNATLSTVDGPRKYFKGEYPELDALTYSAEAGSAWAMLYPHYSSVVAQCLKIKMPVGFALPKSQPDLTQFINTWLEVKKDSVYLLHIATFVHSLFKSHRQLTLENLTLRQQLAMLKPSVKRP